MNRIISIMLAYIMLLFTFDTAIKDPVEEVGLTLEAEPKVGFNKFISDITPVIPDTISAQRTASKLEIINNECMNCPQEINEEDIELLATIVRAEAGNQPLDGKRAVADVVLNRVDNEQFPDTIRGVIYQEGQFNCIHDGNFSRAIYTKDETDYEAARLEMIDRTDSEIIFFQTSSYSPYGTPAYVIGDHYFAKQ